MQASVSALHGGDRVVWVDAGTQLAGPRFNEILMSSKPSNGKQISSSAPVTPRDDDIRSRFHHYIAPTLAHLLAVCTAPMFLPAGTALLVINSVSTLFDSAYPRNTDDRSNGNKNNDGKWASNRRFAVMNDLMSKLGKLAALNNIAVLVTNQTATRIRPGLGAVLLPALSGTEWDNGISTRLVLFKDWPPPAHKDMSDADRQQLGKVRYVGAIKVNGVTLAEVGNVGSVVSFTIQAHGLADFDIPASDSAVQYHTSPVRPPKRTYAEIADSDGEEDEYGWGNGDENEVLAAEGLVDDTLAIDLTATEAEP
ncbi:hypothetical protein H2201_000061 [Coniosporium apollinis]|uniref:RecA family profile 1 domain-containing protein n=1 Tax=Coniosporium apollinis TaxID=61459 RepID=A0ABQ9P533_9PEZI|nr:hypothetical protein H2201_000061 [Coniosporium apollinis]